MGIKSCLNLLIVSVVFGQGIAVPLEENKEESSALLVRQKRASSSSGHIPVNSSPEHPTHGVGIAAPLPRPEPLLAGMVRIYHGTNEIGKGVVIETEPNTIVATTPIFPTKFYAGEYHVKYNGHTGRIDKSYIGKIEVVQPYRSYIKNEEPHRSNEMCLVHTDPGPQKAQFILTVLMESRLFTRDQIKWLVDSYPHEV